MIGDKIKEIRTKKNMTQKELADKLFVTPQAVSRWENGEVEPSISTINDMATIFDVSSDELIGRQTQVKVEQVVVTKPAKPVIGVCKHCNKAIYEGEPIFRIHSGGRNSYEDIRCKKCHTDIKNKAHQEAVREARKQRTWSYVIAPMVAVAIILGLYLTNTCNLFLSIVAGVASFTCVSCLFLDNNVVSEVIATISGWGFIKLPGLIFSLDLDGIIWFITVKIGLAILSFAVSALLTILGIAVGAALSVFIYPFALYNSYNNPEKY